MALELLLYEGEFLTDDSDEFILYEDADSYLCCCGDRDCPATCDCSATAIWPACDSAETYCWRIQSGDFECFEEVCGSSVTDYITSKGGGVGGTGIPIQRDGAVCCTYTGDVLANCECPTPLLTTGTPTMEFSCVSDGMGGCEVKAVLNLAFQGTWTCQPFNLNATKSDPNIFIADGLGGLGCCNEPNIEMWECDYCGYCTWEWYEETVTWHYISSDCESGCLCGLQPSRDGNYDGEVIQTSCVPAPCGYCDYIWAEIGTSGLFSWDLLESNCILPCNFCTPDTFIEGDFEGQILRVPCSAVT